MRVQGAVGMGVGVGMDMGTGMGKSMGTGLALIEGGYVEASFTQRIEPF